MSKRMTAPSLALLVSALLVVPSVEAQDKQKRKLVVAKQVVAELLSAPDRAIPESLLDNAVCICVIPGVIKGALGWGGRHGNGIISCRDRENTWSPPAFVEIGGGSFGLQIGAQATDLVLFFMTERGARSLLSSRFTLGGDASVAAGPVGRTAQAGTDIKLSAEIYSYARSRGLFAGISLDGSRLSPDKKANRRYYGSYLQPESILFEHDVPTYPLEARDFVASLP